jgi:hypothetical protein
MVLLTSRLFKASCFVVLSDLRFWRLLVMSFLLMGLCFFIFRHLVSGTLNPATCCFEFFSLLVDSMSIRSLTLSLSQL